nr:type II toxin-antitoxin system RelE/ParE family toxin [Photorhabdus kleinii]
MKPLTTTSIQPKHAVTLQIQLTAINTAKKPDNMNAPSWKLHPLKGADYNKMGSTEMWTEMQSQYELWISSQHKKPEIKPMECPVCSAAEFIHDTRDLSY